MALVRSERRAGSRLVPASLLTSPVRLTANLACLLLAGAFFATSVLLMLHLRSVLAFSPLQAGLAYLPYAGGTLLGVAASPWLQGRGGPGTAAAQAFVIAAVGMGWLALLPTDATYTADILPGLFVAAVGSGIAFPP